jgi:hypothetical protein
MAAYSNQSLFWQRKRADVVVTNYQTSNNRLGRQGCTLGMIARSSGQAPILVDQLQFSHWPYHRRANLD